MRSGLRWREKPAQTLLVICLLAAIGLPILTAQAQGLPTQGLIAEVATVGMTVSDMDRSVEFYSKVLSFEKVSDVEVWG
ncbi:MAG: VOC family protein, partial [Candidatus Methylomirabilis sp.]